MFRFNALSGAPSPSLNGRINQQSILRPKRNQSYYIYGKFSASPEYRFKVAVWGSAIPPMAALFQALGAPRARAPRAREAAEPKGVSAKVVDSTHALRIVVGK